MDSSILQKLEPFFEKIGNLSRSKRLAIFISTFVVVIVAFTFIKYLPKEEIINGYKQEYNKLKKELVIQKKKALLLKKYEHEIGKAEKEFKVVLKALPEKNEIPSLLTNITDSGKASGLEFILFRPDSEIKKEFYVEIPVKIEMLGNYHSVAVFFDKIASLFRIVNIKDIDMITTKKDDQILLKTSCVAVTYKFVENPKPPQAPKTDRFAKYRNKKK